MLEFRASDLEICSRRSDADAEPQSSPRKNVEGLNAVRQLDRWPQRDLQDGSTQLDAPRDTAERRQCNQWVQSRLAAPERIRRPDAAQSHLFSSNAKSKHMLQGGTG